MTSALCVEVPLACEKQNEELKKSVIRFIFLLERKTRTLLLVLIATRGDSWNPGTR